MSSIAARGMICVGLVDVIVCNVGAYKMYTILRDFSDSLSISAHQLPLLTIVLFFVVVFVCVFSSSFLSPFLPPH